MLFSVNNWSMTVSQICSLNPATTTCKELYDSFLVDVLQQLKSEDKSFDKEDYVNKKIDHAQNELEIAQQSQERQAHESKVLMEKSASNISKIFDAFRSFWHGVLSFLSNFLALLNMTGIESEPEPEEAGVGQDSTNAKTATSPNKENLDPRLKINDLRRQIAMYQELLLTLPAIGHPGYLTKWPTKGWYISNKDPMIGVKDTKELKAFSVMLTWLEVHSLAVKLSTEFATTYDSEALSEFQNAILTNQPMTRLSLVIGGFYDHPIANTTIQLAKETYSSDFTINLARKNVSSKTKPRALRDLSLSGLYGINEPLENLVYYDYDFTPPEWLNIFPLVPHFDYLKLHAFEQKEPLSEKSLETLEGILINGLKEFNFSLKHQRKTGQEPPRMLTKMYSDLFDLSITTNKTLALQKLSLYTISEEDAAGFIRYLVATKNNLEELKLYNLKEVNHSEKLLDALKEIYTNEGGLNSADSHLKLKILSYNAGQYSSNSLNKERAKKMSSFLDALAMSEEAKHLEKLEILSNGLTDENIKVFAQAIEEGRNLCPSIMGLSFNAISINSAWVLADSIKQACDKKVEKLELTGNFKSAAAKNLISAYKPYFEISVH